MKLVEWTFCRLAPGFLGLIKQKDWDAIADGIKSAATCALERLLVGSQCQFLTALWSGADENVQNLLQHHLFNFKQRLRSQIRGIGPSHGRGPAPLAMCTFTGVVFKIHIL